MSYASKILADSISPGGDRLTTFEITFPRMVLPEFNTHRVFSRNSASSRAIPVIKQLRFVLEDPFVPAEFGENQPGMQASRNLTGAKEEAARSQWLNARDDAVDNVISLLTSQDFGPQGAGVEARFEALAKALENKESSDDWLNVHKQLTNRLLEPFMWHTVIVTATEWDNFWHLRTHGDAQPEIREIASRMKELMDAASRQSALRVSGTYRSLMTSTAPRCQSRKLSGSPSADALASATSPTRALATTKPT